MHPLLDLSSLPFWPPDAWIWLQDRKRSTNLHYLPHGRRINLRYVLSRDHYTLHSTGIEGLFLIFTWFRKFLTPSHRKHGANFSSLSLSSSTVQRLGTGTHRMTRVSSAAATTSVLIA